VRKVYIVGIGMTKISRHFNKSLRELFAEASLKAIDDSGNIKPGAVVVGNMMSSSLQEQDDLGALLADNIGLRGSAALKVEAACGSGGFAVATGYTLVASGLYDIVLVGGVEKMTDYPTADTTKALAQAADAEYEVFYGASFPALNALLMRLYMERYGATREDMALWPVMMHDNSYHNPYAQLRFKTTIQHVISSPIIADPIRLLDSSPIGDGAAVVILASEEIAKKITDTPIEIAGVGLSTDSVDLATREDLLTARSIRLAAHKAYKMANVEPKYIDVAEVHDAFSINAMLVLEELGFAERGKAWKMLKEGRFRPGDKPTVNPSGGLKARGHPVGATGVYQVAEVAMQLRGDFPGVRVDKAEIGLAQNMGGVAVSTSVIILKR